MLVLEKVRTVGGQKAISWKTPYFSFSFLALFSSRSPNRRGPCRKREVSHVDLKQRHEICSPIATVVTSTPLCFLFFFTSNAHEPSRKERRVAGQLTLFAAFLKGLLVKAIMERRETVYISREVPSNRNNLENGKTRRVEKKRHCAVTILQKGCLRSDTSLHLYSRNSGSL